MNLCICSWSYTNFSTRGAVLDPPLRTCPLKPRRGPKADPTRGFSRFVLDVSPAKQSEKLTPLLTTKIGQHKLNTCLVRINELLFNTPFKRTFCKGKAKISKIIPFCVHICSSIPWNSNPDIYLYIWIFLKDIKMGCNIWNYPGN